MPEAREPGYPVDPAATRPANPERDSCYASDPAVTAYSPLGVDRTASVLMVAWNCTAKRIATRASYRSPATARLDELRGDQRAP